MLDFKTIIKHNKHFDDYETQIEVTDHTGDTEPIYFGILSKEVMLSTLNTFIKKSYHLNTVAELREEMESIK